MAGEAVRQRDDAPWCDPEPAATLERAAVERLLACLPTAVIALSPAGRVTHWNVAAEALFGLQASAMIGRPLVAGVIGWDRERLQAALSECRRGVGTVKLDELPYRRPDGGEGILGLTISPLAADDGAFLGWAVIGSDITARKAAERAEAQARRLRAIGQLAAGIAHEINTPIQYIGDNLRFLGEAFAELLAALPGEGGGRPGDPPPGAVDDLCAEIPAAIGQCLEGVERISQIVRAMKEFAHPGREEKSPVDLNAVITSAVTVTRHAWKYVAEMRTDLDRSLPPVVCHPGEIGQVVLNMIVNAAQAIEERLRSEGGGKGTITVTTRRREGAVEIAIGDTGCGIPEPIRPHIFEPFFTTKEIGRGSGQGLAICHPVVVERHGGRLAFESEPGRGTVFTITLPLAPPEV